MKAEIGDFIRGERQKGSGSRIRWTSPAKLHLTLCFLGDLPAETVPGLLATLSRVIQQVAEAHLPPLLRIHSGGAFPSVLRPRVLWLDIDDPVRALSAIARGLSDRLGALGFEPDPRAFVPHLTVARLSGPFPGRLFRRLQALDFGEFSPKELLLFETVRANPEARTRYEVLYAGALGSAFAVFQLNRKNPTT